MNGIFQFNEFHQINVDKNIHNTKSTTIYHKFHSLRNNLKGDLPIWRYLSLTVSERKNRTLSSKYSRTFIMQILIFLAQTELKESRDFLT